MMRLFHRIRARLGRFARAEHGVAAVEFGFGSSLLMLLLVGMVDYGGGIVSASTLESAARAGVQYGRTNPDDADGIATVVKNATGLDPATLTVTVTKSCRCPDSGEADCTISVCPNNRALNVYLSVVV